MIFAAGLGTRLRPLTNNKPKALVELNGIPLLQHVIYKLIKTGINEIVINVHHFADLIEDYLIKNNNFGITIHISDEREQLLETGGGLINAKHFFTDCDAVLVYNVDVFSDINIQKLIDYQKSNKPLATLCVRNRKTSRYLLFNEKNQLSGWKNTKTNELKEIKYYNSHKSKWFAFSGIHIINTEIFQLTQRKGKFSIIDLYLALAKDFNIQSFEHNDDVWMDLGKIENLRKAETYFIK